MNTPENQSAPQVVRSWWLSPPRSGIRRWIAPWEYRHLRIFGITRIIGGTVATAAGLICLSYGAYWWAAFFLTNGTLSLAGGCWELNINSSLSART